MIWLFSMLSSMTYAHELFPSILSIGVLFESNFAVYVECTDALLQGIMHYVFEEAVEVVSTEYRLVECLVQGLPYFQYTFLTKL